MQIYYEPWEHFIVEDLIPADEFVILQGIVTQWDKPPHAGRIRHDLEFQTDVEFVQQALQRHVHGVLHDLAVQSFPNLNIDTTYFADEYNVQSKGHEYMIHTDVWDKLVSSVLHVSDVGLGTHLYRSKDRYSHTLPWKPNSCFFFVNGKHKYHSFSSQSNYRVTLSSTLRGTHDTNFH